MGHIGNAFYPWLSFIRPLRVLYVFKREGANDNCSPNRLEMKPTAKENNFQISFELLCSGRSCFIFCFPPLPLFAHFLISPRASFDTPWQWLRSINHPFPWTVSACLLWDETTAISSSAPPTSAPFSAWLSCQSPHTQQSNAVQCFSNHLVCFQAKYDIESLKLIKDDMSEIYATNARLWFKALVK